ncbi:hypothetical protein FNU79_10830 [Deinococcus detaillensis]|uniref:DUF1045 domain-containing protein n=1 Tax=Deinococcus detaillensis TaxID=2592048 RepID=A0A553UW67_9DEIO|nr:hypothetical protein [Deinococcus detaillensis]TSA84457.1 hypothetical protein FNU79_10830 [Deinococcus detaillensis]
MTDFPDAARFAVYLVPPASSPFYQLGSQLLGYDVRAQQVLPLPEFLRPEWQESAAPYGFHLTVVEGFYTDPDRLSAIEQEARLCLGCSSPGADLTLGGGHLAVWEDGRVWVQRFEASPAFLMLHTLLSARLAPFVTASPFDAEVAAGKWQRPFEVARMQLLRTPRGLDTYQPHFTLVQPYGGHDPDGLRERLEALTRPFERLEVASLALCVKPAEDTHWHIQAEWPLPLT